MRTINNEEINDASSLQNQTNRNAQKIKVGIMA